MARLSYVMIVRYHCTHEIVLQRSGKAIRSSVMAKPSWLHQRQTESSGHAQTIFMSSKFFPVLLDIIRIHEHCEECRIDDFAVCAIIAAMCR